MAAFPIESGVHRPGNVDWRRATALLYGDWGTSKAYVLGLAFVAAGFASFPIILAVCALTAIVAYNYIIVCAHFPDGGGVYSAARTQSRFLASVGALLLIANFLVSASLITLDPNTAAACRSTWPCRRSWSFARSSLSAFPTSMSPTSNRATKI